jgi:hypothetical protein
MGCLYVTPLVRSSAIEVLVPSVRASEGEGADELRLIKAEIECLSSLRSCQEDVIT